VDEEEELSMGGGTRKRKLMRKRMSEFENKQLD